MFRFLSYDQLQKLFFENRDSSALRRRLGQLDRQGWLSRWYDPIPAGGHPGYACLTPKGWQATLTAIRQEAEGQPWERLVSLMLPASAQRRFSFTPKIVPPFLAHQREINHLLISWLQTPNTSVRWASSWDRPFPTAHRRVALPQPDYILVIERKGELVVVCGEHDRAQESLDHFKQAKVDRYALLALAPEIRQQLFGITRFEVWVTVCDPVRKNPERRLEKLRMLANGAGLESVMKFALAGTALTNPTF